MDRWIHTPEDSYLYATLGGHGYELMGPVCQQEVDFFQRDRGYPMLNLTLLEQMLF